MQRHSPSIITVACSMKDDHIDLHKDLITVKNIIKLASIKNLVTMACNKNIITLACIKINLQSFKLKEDA